VAISVTALTCKRLRDLLSKGLFLGLESLFLNPLDQSALKLPQTTLQNLSPGVSVHSNCLPDVGINDKIFEVLLKYKYILVSQLGSTGWSLASG
jgi:hypothetical protein